MTTDLCPNGCGQPGPHFVPPSLGEPGFFSCKPLVTEAPVKKSVLTGEGYPFSFPIQPAKKWETLLKEFLRYPSSLLEKPSAPVHPDEMPLLTAEFVTEVEKLCIRLRGYAVAGVQIGMLRRFFVISDHRALNDGKPYPKLWVNPRVIQESAATVYMQEGCLSLIATDRNAQYNAKLKRPEAVLIECDDPAGGAPWRFPCSGLLGRVVQHEMDHLDGKLYTSRLNPIEFDKVRPLLRALTSESKNRK